ncbi:hypothetical protein AAVH_20305 [Aphelenchoides avenae]|nr:hypothetical protein AAVH_20305 [Aphelenchus avenae]
MSKVRHALDDVRAEFDEKTRAVEELAEKLRLQVAESSELKRQLDEAYERLTEQTMGATLAATGPAEALDVPAGPPSRRGKLSGDAWSDVLVFLDRFNIDAAQITHRRWRFIVETMLTTQCLRELNYVTLKRQAKPCESRNNTKACYNDYDDSWGGGGTRAPPKDADCVFVLSFGRSGDATALLAGTAQEEMHRRLTFQTFEAASDCLLRLIRSTTIYDLTLESLVPTEAFFKGLLSIAATVRLMNLTLSGCHMDGVDAGSFQDALLQFQSVNGLAVGRRLLAGQISDGFLASAGGKLALTQLRYESNGPIGAGKNRFDATDHGIMQFLFQRTTKKVTLQISHSNISLTFCTAIFKKALSEPAANDIFLGMRFRNLEQDLTGILDWRLTEDKSKNAKEEVFTAVDALGKRLRLSIKSESFDGATSTVEFRRSEQCQCKANVDGNAGRFGNPCWRRGGRWH